MLINATVDQLTKEDWFELHHARIDEVRALFSPSRHNRHRGHTRVPAAVEEIEKRGAELAGRAPRHIRPHDATRQAAALRTAEPA